VPLNALPVICSNCKQTPGNWRITLQGELNGFDRRFCRGLRIRPPETSRGNIAIAECAERHIARTAFLDSLSG
jgi:hypothetical protein